MKAFILFLCMQCTYFVSITQNIGINTSTPISTLNVKSAGFGLIHSDAANAVQVGTMVSATGGWLGTKSNHNLHFFTNSSSSLMTLTTLGNLGIGYATPNTKLHVLGTNNVATFSAPSNMYVTFDEGGSPRGYIGSYIGNAEDIDFGTYSSNFTGKIHLTVNNNPRLTVSELGRVGIGTVNPEELFSVEAGMVVDQNNHNTGNSANILRFGSLSGEGIGSKRTAGSNQYGVDIYTNNTQRLTVTNGGNVGIGTNTPSEMLEVNGKLKVVSIVEDIPTAVTFEGGWNDLGGFAGASFFKDKEGIVHIQGLVSGATNTITTLPAGYRPSAALAFASSGGTILPFPPFGRSSPDFRELVVYSDGRIALEGNSSNSWVSLSNISFRAGN